MKGPVDYKIVVEAADPEVQDGYGVLEILSEAADEEDAIQHLEEWANTIQQLGRIPRTALDWQNETGAAILRRQGRKAYRMRVESFERETETGTTVGAAWLRVREVPRDA